eukprot:Skav222462  [mRNA]  locus=scaffold5414:21679:25138:- [translate_table: standard]
MTRSTLVALDCAAQAKRLGKCDRSVGFCKMGLALSPDGRCKTFDESANGFTRADGAGAIVLELASDAQKATVAAKPGWIASLGTAE